MKKFSKTRALATLALSAAASLIAMPAHAVLVANGITYTLTDNGSGNYTLSITGINGAADDEGGRYGVESFAFNPPTGFVSATPPAGFAFMDGGLNSGGCDGNGNFFCFDGPTPPAVVLGADSTLSFDFFVDATGLATWDPSFKINWIGTKNNYNLVSLPIGITTSSSSGTSSGDVPEPGPVSLTLLGLGLLGAGFMRRAKQAA